MSNSSPREVGCMTTKDRGQRGPPTPDELLGPEFLSERKKADPGRNHPGQGMWDRAACFG